MSPAANNPQAEQGTLPPVNINLNTKQDKRRESTISSVFNSSSLGLPTPSTKKNENKKEVRGKDVFLLMDPTNQNLNKLIKNDIENSKMVEQNKNHI